MASKFALVPNNMLQDTHLRQQQSSAYSHLARLNTNLQHVLEDPTLGDEEKYVHFKRLLNMHDNMNRYDPSRMPTRDEKAAMSRAHSVAVQTLAPTARQTPAPSPLFNLTTPGNAANMSSVSQAVASPTLFNTPTSAAPLPAVSTGWEQTDIEQLKAEIKPAAAKAIVDAISDKLGKEIDYVDVVKKTGVKVGEERSSRGKLKNAIISIHTLSDYPQKTARAIAKILVDKGQQHLIRNEQLRKELLNESVFRNSARKRFSPASNFKRRQHQQQDHSYSSMRHSTPKQKGKGLVSRWKSLYK